MTRRISFVRAALLAVVLLTLARTGFAQQLGPVSGGSIATPVPPLSPENGAQVGEGVLLHAGVGVEAGYDSNVFYDQFNPAGSAIIRVTPFFDLTNTARNGEIPSGLFFDLRAALTYRKYLSSDMYVSRLAGAFMPAISGSLEHNSRGTLALGVTESFSRLQDPPYVRTQTDADIIRDNNVASAQLRWSPGGGRLQGVLRYTNTLDLFETESLKQASSIGHEGMIDLSWRWLPKTALFLQVRQGYISYLNTQTTGGSLTGTKFSSAPLRATVGLRGLITDKTSVAIAVGYQNGFYSNGTNSSGTFGPVLAAAELVISPIYTTKITVGVRHDFQNSVIGNFYYDEGAYASIAYQTLTKLIAQLWTAYDNRQYHGLAAAQPGLGLPDSRTDNGVQAGAMLDYYLKSWAYAGVSYTLLYNESNAGGGLTGADYTKHQVFARLGVTY